MTDISAVLQADDVAFLNRLFGPRIPAQMADMFEVAKSVEMPHLDGSFIGPAISVMVASIVNTGIGGGICGGWSLRRHSGGVTLAVCRFSSSDAKAA